MASSSSAAQNTQPILVFDGKNNDFWAIKMKTYLMYKKMWNEVQEGVPPQLESMTERKRKRKAREDLETKNLGALHLLQGVVSDEIFPKIAYVKNSKEAWDKLQEEFQGDERIQDIKVHTLCQDYKNMKMKADESVKQYTDRLEIVNQMRNYGDEGPKKDIIQKVLVSLQP